jgi:hypothetical protein
MTNLDIKLKVANTFATIVLVGSHGFSFQDWYVSEVGASLKRSTFLLLTRNLIRAGSYAILQNSVDATSYLFSLLFLRSY